MSFEMSEKFLQGFEQGDTIDRERYRQQALDMTGLFQIVNSIFVEIVSVNLTKNTYRMIQYDSITTRNTPKEGIMDEMINIRIPYVAEQHQLKNAMALVNKGAGVCVEEHTLGEGALSQCVRKLIEDPAARREMGSKISEFFATPNANEQIYNCLMELVGSQRK